jgi:hypothetical protein
MILPISHTWSNSMLVDPTSDLSARIVFENLIENRATRKTILKLLADSIIQVHKQGKRSGTWAVTLGASGGFIRMNVGRIEVFAIYLGLARLILDSNKLPNTAAIRLQRSSINRFDGKPVYVSVPCSQMWEFPIEKFPPAIPILRDSYESLLEKASASVAWRTGYYRTHSPGVLEYLRQVTRLNIPDPDYLRPTTTPLRK